MLFIAYKNEQGPRTVAFFQQGGHPPAKPEKSGNLTLVREKLGKL